MHWLIGNALVHLEQVSPSNLTLVRSGEHEPVWEELFQGEATPDRLAERLAQLRVDEKLRSEHQQGSVSLRRLMGQGVGIEAVAKAWRG